MYAFIATIEIIGINPFVFIPEDILQKLFVAAKKNKGKIPVRMTIDGHEFRQTLIRYSGFWRLYLNTPMRKAADKDVGDSAMFGLSFDAEQRIVPMHPKFSEALDNHPAANAAFMALAHSRRLEILKYMSFLKQESSVMRNIDKVICMLSDNSAGHSKSKRAAGVTKPNVNRQDRDETFGN